MLNQFIFESSLSILLEMAKRVNVVPIPIALFIVVILKHAPE